MIPKPDDDHLAKTVIGSFGALHHCSDGKFRNVAAKARFDAAHLSACQRTEDEH